MKEGLRLLGLTGSIATGKSNAADAFAALGVPVFDADRTVHRLLGPQGAAVAEVLRLFPEAADGGGGIDRGRLAARVFANAAALRALEAVLHPRVREAEYRFLQRCARARVPLAVLDIPLLFETGAEHRVDRVLVVTCHPLIQEIRALRRPGMSPERLARVRAEQWPEGHKRRRADFVITTSLGRDVTRRQIEAVYLRMLDEPARAWPWRWRLQAARARWRR